MENGKARPVGRTAARRPERRKNLICCPRGGKEVLCAGVPRFGSSRAAFLRSFLFPAFISQIFQQVIVLKEAPVGSRCLPFMPESIPIVLAYGLTLPHWIPVLMISPPDASRKQCRSLEILSPRLPEIHPCTWMPFRPLKSGDPGPCTFWTFWKKSFQPTSAMVRICSSIKNP